MAVKNALKNVLQERCRQKERRRPYREYWTLFFRIKFFMKKAVVELLCLVAKCYISQTLHYSFSVSYTHLDVYKRQY